MKIGKCWVFHEDEQPPYPTIELIVSSGNHEMTVNPKVDTGFNGSLAIGKELVRLLHLIPIGMILVRTAAGDRELPVYAVKLSQPDLGVAVGTIAIGTDRALVGRRLLQNRTWLLDCKEERFCIVT